MTTGSNDLYSILDIRDRRWDPVLTERDLRAAYKRALLKHHPDKHGVNDTTSAWTVDQISLAYRILSDSKLRAEYDAASRKQDGDLPSKFRTFHTGLDTYDLDELVFDTVSGSWSKACRCGDDGGFVITEPELEANVENGEIITGCKGCSLWIKVLFSVAEG